MAERVSLQLRQSVAYVELNRPEKCNALDYDMFLAIDRVQKSLRRESGLRAVVLSGSGSDFCSGIDIHALMGNRGAALKLIWKWWPWRTNLAQRVAVGWQHLAVPVIACLEGRCWGGGLQIALGADFRVASPNASLSIMEGKWGLIPDMGGTLALRDLVPRDQALKLAMTAEIVSAPTALELGLLTAIDENPSQYIDVLVAELLERSPDALASVKQLYRRSWGREGRVLAEETWHQLRIFAAVNRRIAVARAQGRDKHYRPKYSRR